MSGQGSCCGGGDKVTDGKTIDPVCGMTVDPATAKHLSTHDGQTFYFCGAGCKAKFDAAPATYPGAVGKRATEGCCNAKPVAWMY